MVAEDAQEKLAGSQGMLLLGCGQGMTAGTYWSGLIDDMRICRRAVRTYTSTSRAKSPGLDVLGASHPLHSLSEGR